MRESPNDPADAGPLDAGPIDAGDFLPWLTGLHAALRGEQDADVPCGTCTACCRSGQFVHVEPDETDALAHIPSALLFPAPGLPAGHVLLGYDEQGRCPMLGERGCTIYAHRPRTCRAYDCRVFPATGLDPAADGKPAIAERTRRWRFRHPSAQDDVAHDAVRAAAADLRPQARSATHAAVLAIQRHKPDAAAPGSAGAGDAG